jgi:hypothetical protein
MVALEAERARESTLARESEEKLVALRQREDRRSAAEQDATAAALSAAEAAYEARWRDPSGSRPAVANEASGVVPSYGVPVGAVMPSMTESVLFDVYAEGADPLGRPDLQVADVEPPSNDVQIEEPALELDDLSVIPRPFRGGSEPVRQ